MSINQDAAEFADFDLSDSEQPKRPFIVFERVMNAKHSKDSVDKKSGAITQLKRRVEKWTCYLADSNGELHPWATLSGIQHYINKGYKPIELGDFDAYLQRKKPNQDMVLELITLRNVLTNTVQKEQALGDAVSAKQEAEARAAELQAAFEAQAKELEELKKLAAKQRKEEDKAAKTGGAA